MYYCSKNINKKYLNDITNKLSNSERIYFYKAIIIFSSIIINKRIELIPYFKLISDVGYLGKKEGILNKECRTILITCSRDISIVEYLALKII